MYGCLDGRVGDIMVGDIMMASNGMSDESIARDGYSGGHHIAG
jgi:hypothetical protein